MVRMPIKREERYRVKRTALTLPPDSLPLDRDPAREALTWNFPAMVTKNASMTSCKTSVALSIALPTSFSVCETLGFAALAAPVAVSNSTMAEAPMNVLRIRPG